ncbi:cytochrome b [Pseudomonas sp. NPDC089569]|uniref:cytochrome b n=1 Tax=Pseudomonas sp. NPDC089569 TaxID=3390722 RepID=UPI003D006CC9
MKQSKYSKTQVALHWLSAFIILWSLCAGTYVALFKVSPDMKTFLTALNISLTTLFIPFFLLRAVLRVNHLRKYPAGPGELLATFVHNLIYLITAIVLLTGVLMMTRPIVVFGLLSLPPLITDAHLLRGFHAAHQDSTAMLGGLVLLHLAAVVKHELSGNRILKNMSFRASAWNPPLHAREGGRRQAASHHGSVWVAAPSVANSAQPVPTLAAGFVERRRTPRHEQGAQRVRR